MMPKDEGLEYPAKDERRSSFYSLEQRNERPPSESIIRSDISWPQEKEKRRRRKDEEKTDVKMEEKGRETKERGFDIGRSLNLTRAIEDEDEGGRGCIWRGGERESYSLSDSIEHNSWFDVFARLTIVIFEVSCLLE